VASAEASHRGQSIELLISIASETGTVLYEGSLYILLGFFIAGLLNEFLPTDTIAKHLGAESPRSVFLAALFGAPIPLCSCGVLPAAAALRDKGASRSSTLSFLISTPETGVDSIALTYGLLGPVMAIVRPAVAVLTGAVAGIISIALPDDDDAGQEHAAGCPAEAGAHTHADGTTHGSELAGDGGGRVRRILRYGFTTLLDEIGFWLVTGIVLTGILSALLPDDFFTRVLGWESGILPMLAMVAAGVPLYLCASASTPVAAALIAKGLSPGAALVFLLVGPATNAATMTVVARLLGARRLRIYLGSIVFVALGAGLAVDAFGGDAFRQTVLAGIATPDPTYMVWLKNGAALVFVVMLVASLIRTGFRTGITELVDQLKRIGPAFRNIAWQRMLTPRALAAAAVALTLYVASTTLLVVPPGYVGVTQRFGAISTSDLEPGLHLHAPPPLGRGTAIDTAERRVVAVGFRGSAAGRRTAIGNRAFYLTADENIIDLRLVVEYHVDDPVRFAFATTQAQEAVRAIARREIVDLVGGRDIDTLYTIDRGTVEAGLRRRIGARVDIAELGCAVTGVRLLDVHAPADVHDAFRDIASAIEDRNREIHDAAGYAAESAASTAGEISAIASAVRAERLSMTTSAEADTNSFTLLAREYDDAKWLTKTRLYFETMERMLGQPRKYIHSARNRGGDVDVWIGANRNLPPFISSPDKQGKEIDWQITPANRPQDGSQTAPKAKR